MTGMAIPFIVVTSCIVLASANAFHAKIDSEFRSDDWTVVQQSRLFNGTESMIMKRMLEADPNSLTAPASDEMEVSSEQWQSEQVAKFIAKMNVDERIVASALVKPNTEALAKTLQPVLGSWSNAVFGFGVLGMGFSTIIILMLINGYAVAEIF